MGKKTTCFVIMPFGNPVVNPEQARRFELIYSQWIKPTVESIADDSNSMYGIQCHRADKTQMPGEIITHVIDQLANADLVIADLTDQNPNVFYELGVRHSLHNNTILVAQNIADIPFDLRALRTIEYRYDPEHMLTFRDRLIQAIKCILVDSKTIDNPVGRYLHSKAVNELVSHSVSSDMDTVKSMATELVSLRKNFEQFAGQMRQVVETITTINARNPVAADITANTLEKFQGIWRSIEGGIYCARMINGRLFIPYCYMGADRLTGHFFDCTTVGETLVGKFEWFGTVITGFAYFRPSSSRRLEGGWWYAHSVPLEYRHDLSQLNESVPGMERTAWEKTQYVKSFPEWAENYFSLKLYERTN